MTKEEATRIVLSNPEMIRWLGNSTYEVENVTLGEVIESRGDRTETYDLWVVPVRIKNDDGSALQLTVGVRMNGTIECSNYPVYFPPPAGKQ